MKVEAAERRQVLTSNSVTVVQNRQGVNTAAVYQKTKATTVDDSQRKYIHVEDFFRFLSSWLDDYGIIKENEVHVDDKVVHICFWQLYARPIGIRRASMS